MLTVDEEPEMAELQTLLDGDLDYYAKPENYQGTRDSMLRFLTTHHRPTRDSSPAAVDDDPTGKKALPREPPPPPPDPSRKALPGVWTYNRGSLDRVTMTSRPAATYVRRITVYPGGDDDAGQAEGEPPVGGEAKRGEGRSSIAVTGLRDGESYRSSDAVLDSSRSTSVPGGGSAGGAPLRREAARNRFRRSIQKVLIILRLSTIIEKQANRAEHDDLAAGQMTFTDIASEVTNAKAILTFDLSHFKSKKELAITRDVRQILTTPFAQRTPQQIQTACYGLKHLESFAEYPQHMREKLCQVGWFQKVSPKRVIIRQGQPPENFYFVLSGQAVVRFHEQNPMTGENVMRTVAMLRRGSSFGELALLHHTRRTATVVSQGVVQLLSIGKEDFFRIIMGLSPDGSVPDHIRFLSTLDFMEGWPMDVLASNPDKCMFLYFKRGTVMVRDSTKSDWIYVVKSGSCQVIKKLSPVAPRTLQQRKQQSDQRRFPPELNASIAFSNIVKSSARRISEVEARTTSHEDLDLDIDLHQSQQSPGGVEKRSRRWSYAGVPSTAAPTSDEEKPVFIEVETLLPKDTFGLRNINFESDFEPATGVEASVILVSRGAECVMLSKRCFIEHANPIVRHRIRTEIRPYPTDEVIDANLQTHVDWVSYKKRLIRALVNSTRSVRRRHQSRVGHCH